MPQVVVWCVFCFVFFVWFFGFLVFFFAIKHITVFKYFEEYKTINKIYGIRFGQVKEKYVDIVCILQEI